MKVLLLVLGFITYIVLVSSELNVREPALPCNSTICKLPDCLCAGTTIPGGLTRNDTPQFVMINFDDAVNVANIDYYREALSRRKNPNNCSISANFFVSHEYTDYSLVHELRSEGHEISSHSISHSQSLNDTVEHYESEYADHRILIEKFANISGSEVQGIRPSALNSNSNNFFQMLKENNFLFESSVISCYSETYWPFTTEFKIPSDCHMSVTESFPKVWVMQNIDWKNLEGQSCSTVDSCVNIPNTSDGLFDWMKNEFNKQYTGNRAPFAFNVHAAWFVSEEVRFDAFKRFLDYLGSLNDVYIAKIPIIIDWIKSPKTVNQMLNTPITCHKLYIPSCSKKTCELWDEQHQFRRFMTSCVDECPKSYPGLGNPLGNN